MVLYLAVALTNGVNVLLEIEVLFGIVDVVVCCAVVGTVVSVVCKVVVSVVIIFDVVGTVVVVYTVCVY